jgi:hypothetical protein
VRRRQRRALDRTLANEFVFGEDDPPFASGAREPLFVRRVLREDGVVRDRSDTRRNQGGGKLAAE